ncbi:MAG: NFACT RNA binding domain-containing protein [Reichenbachiella sp.]|uniref:NFACT RNA binding domain-containing protein n=1 Tax=Reichenbachiella sp. TaxID=2184521 RepID=UPI003299DAE2
MQFNYYFLKALSNELSKHLVGNKISAIFSQNKNELVLCFINDRSNFFIKANLDGQSSLLSFSTSFARAKKNSVDLFSELSGQHVLNVRQFENERSFSIQFEKNFELLFKLHGRHSNILLFQKNELLSLFKNNIEKDQQLKLNDLDRPINQSKEAIINVGFDLFKIYPTFDKHIKNHLKVKGFYEEGQPLETKMNVLESVLSELNDSNFYLLKEVPGLRLIKPDTACEVYNNPIEVSNQLARSFFSNQGFAQLKNKLLTQVNKEINKCESYISQNENKLTEIENRRGYDELANILMANLHLKLDPSASHIELFDFYANEQVKIKLKPKLSLQHNAEHFYRKAKNQSKEVEILKNNILSKKKILKELIERKDLISSMDDIKKLKTLEKTDTKSNNKEPKPFIEFEIEGFQVFAGKNAKNNDLLTQKFAKKDDLWLHARDVSGSHVIIRNPNGIKIPIGVIEQVAQIAAWHSKRKSDTLCPVIYTQKKYVRKPKGSLPGQVLLSKEEVILVEPKRDIHQ